MSDDGENIIPPFLNAAKNPEMHLCFVLLGLKADLSVFSVFLMQALKPRDLKGKR